jgi:predicted alpha/beta superfamily hydrolase
MIALTAMTRREALVLPAAAAVLPQPIVAAGSDLIRFEQMASAFIEPRTVHVWLPPSYHVSTRRFPVIYMHDGQNLFTPAYAFGGQAWEVDAALTSRTRPDASGSAIVVGIWNTPKRRSDYAPNAIENFLQPPLQQRIERENGGPSAGDAYLKFIVEELKPLIDKSFRTLKSAEATSIVGASRGGMISLYGLCEYPHIFGSAGCLSTHWLLLSAPNATTNPNLETEAITDVMVAYLRTKLPEPGTHKIWMDHGTLNLDSYYAPYQARVDAAFETVGWQKVHDYYSRVYAGGDHNEAAWRARFPEVLDFILNNNDGRS